MASKKLIAVGGDAKTVKGEKSGFLTGILYLSPSDTSGIRNVCPWASPGCKATCLNTAGRGAMSSVQKGRLRKTELLYADAKAFHDQLQKDLRSLQRKAMKKGFTPCVRLDGTSDLGMASRYAPQYPEIQFYDYTKSFQRYFDWLASPPSNYYLTLSYSETVEWGAFANVLAGGGTVAMAFDVKKKESLPMFYRGFPVIDGDANDVRFRDPKGVIVGLRAKGKARKDTTGFVVRDF